MTNMPRSFCHSNDLGGGKVKGIYIFIKHQLTKAHGKAYDFNFEFKFHYIFYMAVEFEIKIIFGFFT